MDAEKKAVLIAKVKKRVKIGFIVLTILIIIAIITSISIMIPYRYHHPSTEDSYVNANVVNIAPRVSGPVLALYVSNLDSVKKGQLLFDIDPKPFIIALEKAKATLSLAENESNALHAAVESAESDLAAKQAQLHVTAANTARQLALYAQGFTSPQAALDAQSQLTTARMAVISSKSNLKQAILNAGEMGPNNAEIQQAAADVHKAELNLEYTHVYAPASGKLINLTLRPGSWLLEGESQFSLIEDNAWWVDANYKEQDVGRIHLGMPAEIRVDMYPDYVIKGVVEEISSGSGAAFSLLPPENATGNWVKVTRRFPVKIALLNVDKNHPLRVGASATVTVDATSQPNEKKH